MIWILIWPVIISAMTGYVGSNDTLVKLPDGSGYTNYTNIFTASNLAFQLVDYASMDPIGPVLRNYGPNVTLWTELSQGEYRCIYTERNIS